MSTIKALVPCRHQTEGRCCFRMGQKCGILISTTFPNDDDCRFRKEYPDGRNLYDERRKAWAD